MSRQVELQEESSAPFTSREVDPLSSAKRLTTSVIRMESQLANMKAKTGAMYINCGGMAYGGMRDDQGLYSGDTKTYVTDKFVGITKRQHKDWAMAAEQAMMTHRYAVTGSLMYMIPADKPHFVTLYFAEIYEPMMGIGRREFHVFFNKKQFHLDHENSNVVDVFKDKGRLTLGMKTVLAIKPVNGHIHIMLHRIPGKNNPMISAISLEPAGGSE